MKRQVETERLQAKKKCLKNVLCDLLLLLLLMFWTYCSHGLFVCRWWYFCLYIFIYYFAFFYLLLCSYSILYTDWLKMCMRVCDYYYKCCCHLLPHVCIFFFCAVQVFGFNFFFFFFVQFKSRISTAKAKNV